MSVSYATIIEKMMEELEKAQVKNKNRKPIEKHIAHVKLLGDLILEEGHGSKKSTGRSHKEMTDQELKVMLGSSDRQSFADENIKVEAPSPEKDELLGGDSIFDF